MSTLSDIEIIDEKVAVPAGSGLVSPKHRTSGCTDSVRLTDKVIILFLITLGIESAVYFTQWWFEPQHRKNIFFFLILSFAIIWGVARSIINWFYFVFITIPVPKKYPANVSVDVFTTAMPGEPYEMFLNTLNAIEKIQYPHETYLLDGGNDIRLKRLCEQLGIHHINCMNVKGAKAGKINYALTKTNGEFILVIDPDHIPEPDFFEQVLGHFNDPNVGFVQVVQAYNNQHQSMVAQAAAEQTYGFYGPSMMGMNGLGTAVAIGANCTFRRKALDSINGHAIHLAEDLVTSVRIHAHGWKSIYVPYRMSFGLVPEDLQSFFKQQLKWCVGMFQAFSGEIVPRIKSLSFTQNLHYLFAGTFYLEGIATAVTCILPILFLFFGIWAVEMQLNEFLLHIIPYTFFSFVIGWYMQRWFRHPTEKGFLWRGMFLKIGTWPIYVLGFIYFVTRTKVPYLPTPKNKEKGIFTSLVIPHILIILLSICAIIFNLTTSGRIDDGELLMIFFAVCNIILMIPTVYMAHENLFTRKHHE